MGHESMLSMIFFVVTFKLKLHTFLIFQLTVMFFFLIAGLGSSKPGSDLPGDEPSWLLGSMKFVKVNNKQRSSWDQH